MDNNKIFSNPLAILRGTLLLLVYSTLFFFVFYYGRSNQGRFFDGELSTYGFYFLVCLVISIWMARSQSFNKQVLKVAGALIVLDIIAMFIPVGFGSLGTALFPTLVYLLILLAISTLIYNFSKILSDKQSVSIVIAIILFLILSPVVYVNYNDLSVKQKVIYKNNAMFDSIEECNAYFYGVRENDCKKDWTALHDNWDLLEKTKNINLIPNQKAVTGSDNYQYFPAENISDIKIGTGEVARYDDKAIVNILSATINGKIYDHPKKSDRINTDEVFNNYEVNLNTSVESYNSYALGVIGMRVGGMRKINFKTSGGFWFSGTDPMVSVGNNEMVSYTVELVSIKK